MGDIIFARTRYAYDSYTDYYKLVQLSGFPICYIDEMDVADPNNLYIVSPMNGEMLDFMSDENKRNNHKATLIQWNLERPSGSNGMQQYINDNKKLLHQDYFDMIIVSDHVLAQQSGFVYVPMGSHEGLGYPGDYQDKFYDFIHLSCYSSNRSWLFKDPSTPKEEIDGLKIATNGWGEERHQRLLRSRFMVNVHQDEYMFIEPIRFSLAI